MHLLSNILVFLLIVLIQTLNGLGLLRLCGLGDFQQRLLIAPTMAIAVSAIIIALIVILGIPVGVASPGIWLFWFLFTVYGGLHFRSALIDLADKHILCISILVTMLVTGGFLWYGIFDFFGSPALDGWSYVSFGEYLRQYPRGTEGGLAPIYQYATHLSGTRYIASAMLAALIPPWSSGIDTQMTVGPLLILSIFSFALSLALAAKMVNKRGKFTPAWLAVIFGVVGGWVPHAINVNNFDNLLAICFAPALFAVGFSSSLNKLGQIFLPAIFIAASIYIYPELSPLIIAAYGVIAFESIVWPQKESGSFQIHRDHFFKYLSIVVLVMVILSPYLRVVVNYFQQQFSYAAQTAGRPGEGMAPNLLDPIKVWGAIWGVDGRVWDSKEKAWDLFIGVLFGYVTIMGIGRAVAAKYFSIILYLILMVILLGVMVIQKHYDYGAYKILLIGWWVVSITLAAGVQGIWDAFPSSSNIVRSYLRLPIVIICFGAISAWAIQQYIWTSGYKHKTVLDVREVRDVILSKSSPVLVSVSDAFFNAWLVYELRDAVALFNPLYGYMDLPHVRPLMARSSVPSESEIEFLLTEIGVKTVGEVAWQNSHFKLVKGSPGQQPPQLTIRAPNGPEIFDGKPFFWLGLEPALIVLTTSKAKQVNVDIESIAGPSLGSSVSILPNTSIEIAGKTIMTFNGLSSSKHSVSIELAAGANLIQFKTEYHGTVFKNGNGDPRTLLVGIKLLNIEIQ